MFFVLKRPYLLTSTGEILDKEGFFVYFSSSKKFDNSTILVDVLEDKNMVKEFYGNVSIFEQKVFPDRERVERVSKLVENFIKEGMSEEESIIRAVMEIPLSDDEIDIVERRFLKEVNAIRKSRRV